MAFERKDLQEFARRHRSAFESLLAEFVEVPSVSADPERKGDVERTAELALATLRRFGGPAELYRVPGGSPVVLGSFGSDPGVPRSRSTTTSTCSRLRRRPSPGAPSPSSSR